MFMSPGDDDLNKRVVLPNNYEADLINMHKDHSHANHVFCNVELNCQNLEAVGFDMDFTLAQYNDDFNILAFEGAKQKLVHQLGYPEEVLDFKYDPQRFRRGLIIDKKRGNILKIDRHKYVRKVYHGTEELSTRVRKAIYTKQVTSFTEKNFVNIDTIFLLIDALLFSYLVDLFNKSEELKETKSFEELYADVRQSVDLCHRDGVIKDAVMKDPEKYVIYDELLVPLLVQMKRSGKKVFLLTNSLWDYTNVIMEFLVHSKGRYADIQWKDLFDIVIVGAGKPSFLTNEYLALFKVDKKGFLYNIEDKDALGDSNKMEVNKVFQGGHWQDLHKMMGVSSGDKILYVGDHMYADILRSKRTVGWRTCLIIPELENELKVAREQEELSASVTKLRKLQYDLDEYIDIMRQRLRMGAQDVQMMQLLEAEAKAEELKLKVSQSTEQHNRKFNRFWGQIFKAGHQDSRFAKQVMDYACLYTSRASNLAFVSPNRSFRPIRDFMTHEHHLEREE